MGSFLVAILLGIRGFFRWLFSKEAHTSHSDQEIESMKAPAHQDIEKIRFRARIAIIDDEEVPFARMLNQNGYNINYYSDMENIDEFIHKKYHIVVLDIHGIGSVLAEKSEGWGILRYLKHERPHMVVIIYSGGQWTMAKHRKEIELADDIIDKDAEFLDFKSTLDDNIRKAFSPDYHIAVQQKLLKNEIEDIETYLSLYDLIRQKPRNKEKTLRQVRKITTNEKSVRYIEEFLFILADIDHIL